MQLFFLMYIRHNIKHVRTVRNSMSTLLYLNTSMQNVFGSKVWHFHEQWIVVNFTENTVKTHSNIYFRSLHIHFFHWMTFSQNWKFNNYMTWIFNTKTQWFVYFRYCIIKASLHRNFPWPSSINIYNVFNTIHYQFNLQKLQWESVEKRMIVMDLIMLWLSWSIFNRIQ